MNKHSLLSFILVLLIPPTAWAQEDEFELDPLPSEVETMEAPQPDPVGDKDLAEEIDYKSLREPKKIRHPLSKKGLIRITRDRTYIYKTESTEQKHAASIRFGVFDPVNLENPDNAASFDDNYPDAENPIIMIDYEWHFWKTAVGKFGLKAGSGLFFANGNGRFKSGFAENAHHDAPKEVFTFVAFPNNVGLVYRLQLWDRQLLVPYVDGGLLGFTFAEFRDDGKNPRFGFAPAAYGSAGLAFNLSSIDAIASWTLDSEYGINAVYIVGEYKTIATLGGPFDLSSDVINGGFLMEF